MAPRIDQLLPRVLFCVAAVLSLVPKPLAGASVNVNIVDFAFNPASVTIQANDSVQWTWIGPTTHSATSNTGLWNSGLLNAATNRFSHTFRSSGSFPYFCEVHPFMTASVTVQAPPPPPSTNLPPSVSITAPANGATFPAPWTGAVAVTDSDSDGKVVELDLRAGATLLGSLTNPPANASFSVSNLAAGSYTLTAVATDDGGASAASAGVQITITSQTQTNPPPTATNLLVQVLSPVLFDPQTGLFEQSVGVTNATGSPVEAVRLLAAGLPADVVLYNASGSTNGVPFVEYDLPLAPGSGVGFLLEYYRSNRVELVETDFLALPASPAAAPGPAGTVLQLDRSPFFFQGKLVIEFASVPGDSYVVQYSADAQTWSSAVPPVVAAGTRVQWIDSGPPKTSSAPGAAGQRFYRVVQSP